MQIILNEQECIDAACLFLANRYRLRPEQFEVDLHYDPQQGFSAQALQTGGGGMGGFFSRPANPSNQYYMSEQDLIDSIAVLLSERFQMDPHRLDIDLTYQQQNGFGATIIHQ